MVTGHGLAVKAGWAREALVYTPTWPAGTPAQITGLLPLLDESVQEVLTLADEVTIGDPSASQASGVASSAVVDRMTQGSFRLRPRYQGLEGLWGAALGYQAKRVGATVLPETLTTGAYRHLFEVDDHLQAEPWELADGWLLSDGLLVGQRKIRRGTLAVLKGVSVWESMSCMIDRLTLRATPSETTLEIQVAGYAQQLAPSVNTSAVVDALEDSSGLASLAFTDLVVRVAAFSASTPLASGDVVHPGELELTVDNRLARGQTVDTAPYPAEFDRSDACQITGMLRFPRYTSNTLPAALGTQQVLMMDWTWTGPAIGATGYDYTLTCYFPTIVLRRVEVPTRGPAVHQPTVAFQAQLPSQAAAGFPTSVKTGPLMVEIQSGESNHILL